jgi:cell division protein FtsB
MCGLLALIVFGDNGLVELSHLRSSQGDLIKANEQLTQENMRLYRTIDRLQNDLSYIENVARQELGMIRPDELIFKFKTETKKP